MTEKDKLEQSQAEEIKMLNKIHAVHTNKFFIGIDGDMFRITFCETTGETNQTEPRYAVIMTKAGLVQVMQMCRMILEAHSQRQEAQLEHIEKESLQ